MTNSEKQIEDLKKKVKIYKITIKDLNLSKEKININKIANREINELEKAFSPQIQTPKSAKTSSILNVGEGNLEIKHKTAEKFNSQSGTKLLDYHSSLAREKK